MNPRPLEPHSSALPNCATPGNFSQRKVLYHIFFRFAIGKSIFYTNFKKLFFKAAKSLSVLSDSSSGIIRADKKTKEKNKMIFAILFLIALFFFPNIKFFALILFAIYLLCTLAPEIAAEKTKEKVKKAV